jgi:predicted dehydrogenase
LAALKAGKHVICETPPVLNAGEAKKLAGAAAKAGKVLLYACQRRFGGAEQAARLTIDKGYVGEAYHARASWMRTRGIPAGTGWYTDKSKAGGGALMDLGVQMLDLAWHLLGQPRPTSAYAIFNQRYRGALPPEVAYDVEDAGFALLKFEGGKSLELSASWAINQPPREHGTKCQIYADKGALVVYSPQGPLLYRGFNPGGEAKETPLKTPKIVHYHAMMRHFKECIAGTATPVVGAGEGLALMQMLDAIYKSAGSGKSVEIRASDVGGEKTGEVVADVGA